MAQDKNENEPKVTNEVSDETGQYDMRFLLWRKFCADNQVPVETLPSQLTNEQREVWDKVKQHNLKQ
ncbi:MAG: hypothetical protein QOD00_1951 [Blastocatellia bacterium]|nr:hypothetical protein [Blastocatellia bacterium]